MPRLQLIIAVLSLAALAACSPTKRDSARLDPSEWTARRIWTELDTSNLWVAFRKTFNLDSVPEQVTTQIAVDTKYWLYVNGKLGIQEGGLKRGPNRNDGYYDEIELASSLQPGDNTIAVLVQHFGKSGSGHHDSLAAGLIFQSDVVVSDATWKAIKHPGFGNDSDVPFGSLSEWNEWYDAGLAAPLEGWTEPDYDDSAWPAAVDKAGPTDAPWNNLILRPIPFFRYSELLDYVNADSLPTQGNDDAPIEAVMPSNIQVTAYLKVNAPAGVTITMRTDHYADGGPGPYYNIKATYVTKDGEQEFRSLTWMSGTTVLYEIPSSVQILSLKYIESGYDTNFSGQFESNDEQLNVLWQKCVRTCYVDIRDHYMDCPTRERAQWGGDSVNEILTGYYVFDERYHALMHKLTNQFVGWQRSDGVLFSPVPPGSGEGELPPQSLANVWNLRNIWRFTLNEEVLFDAYDHISTYLKLWTIDENGMVNHRAGDWDWADWGDNIDGRLLENIWYIMAANSTGFIAQLQGNTDEVNYWWDIQNQIISNFDKNFWREDAGEYRTGDYTGETDDRGNALAVVAGLVDPSRYPAIINVLTTQLHASPYMEMYVLRALYEMRAPVQSNQRMRQRYADMIADPGYTVWEFFDKASGTDNHAWAAGPAHVLAAYAVGYRPNHAFYDISPQLGDFTSLHYVSSLQNLDITITSTENGVDLNVVSTESKMPVRIGVPKDNLVNPDVTVNGNQAVLGGVPVDSIPDVDSFEDTEHYYYFTVTKQQTYQISATSN